MPRLKLEMDILGKVLKRILAANPDLGVGVQEARILEFWEKAMGESIAKHSKATHMEGSTLFVSVDHPVWRQELHSNKMLALKKLNQTIDEALGKHATRATWVEDLFLTSSQGSTSKPPKAARSFRGK